MEDKINFKTCKSSKFKNMKFNDKELGKIFVIDHLHTGVTGQILLRPATEV